MSTVSYRKRGKTWEYRFEGAKINGKRTQISKGGFQTKKEAALAGTKALESYQRCGIAYEPKELSVADYLDYWMEHYVILELEYNTQINYKRIIENHLKPHFGSYYLTALAVQPIQEFSESLKLNGYSKSHITGILSVLSVALDYAIEPLHYIPFNPVRSVKKPKSQKPQRERIILKPEEFTKIINRFPDGSRFYLPIMIGYHTGLRISECFGLTWDDIDLEHKELTVRHQLVKRDYSNALEAYDNRTKKTASKKSSWCLTPKLKTPSSERVVKFGDTLKDILIKEKNRQQQNEKEYNEYYTIHTYTYETDVHGTKLKRITSCSAQVAPSFPRIHMVCIEENGELTTPESFKPL